MPILTPDKNTHHILRSDIDFLLRLVSDKDNLELFPLTPRGKQILKMLWQENKSFLQVSKELSLSRGRVTQIYHLEIRRFAFFIDKAYKEYKEFVEMKKELETLKQENKLLKNNSRIMRRLH